MEQTRYTKSGDAHLAYRVRGDGPVDLLFPSFGTISIATFDEQPRFARFLERLATFTRLILYDTRGVGLSDPLKPGDETLERHVDDAVAVLDAVGSDRAAVFGSFVLGPSMTLLAASRPERVSALILDNTFARLARAPDYPAGIPADLLEEVMSGAVDTDDPIDTTAMLTALAPSSVDDEALRSWWEGAGQRGASPATARSLQNERFWADVRDVLPRISAPTLVLHRRDSRWIRVGHGRYLAEHIPDTHYVEMDGGDQFPFTDCSDLVVEEIEEFLTGRRTPPPVERALATVLFTDIVRSTERASELGDQRWRQLLDEHDNEMRRLFESFGGREVKTTGDGFLATFVSPGRAVECARATCEALAALGIEIRAGIHAGEVEIRGEDIGGIAVHIGQRISTLAAPGEVLVSRTLKDLVVGAGFEFEDRGSHTLKGVPDEWQVFAVVG